MLMIKDARKIRWGAEAMPWVTRPSRHDKRVSKISDTSNVPVWVLDRRTMSWIKLRKEGMVVAGGEDGAGDTILDTS